MMVICISLLSFVIGAVISNKLTSRYNNYCFSAVLQTMQDEMKAQMIAKMQGSDKPKIRHRVVGFSCCNDTESKVEVPQGPAVAIKGFNS